MLLAEDENPTNRACWVRDDLLTRSVVELMREDLSIVLLQAIAETKMQDASDLPESILNRIFTFPLLGDSVAGLALGLLQQSHCPIVDLGECSLHLQHYAKFFVDCIERGIPLPLIFCTRTAELNLPGEYRQLFRFARPENTTALIEDLKEGILLPTPTILSLTDLASGEESHACC